MDAGTAYNAHSSQAKRKNRSSTNLNRLSLAPLTTKIPINDADMIHSELDLETSYHVSYIQGKSAPTTPSLLARSPLRAKSPGRPHGNATPPHSKSALSKSKSATHLEATRGRKPRSGATTPGGHRRGPKKDEQEDQRSASSATGRADSDWMLRAGVLISSETREFKGQSWLVSRVSSTSLERIDDDDNVDAFEKERRAREEIVSSRQASRRGSLGFVLEDDASPYASRRNSLYPSRTGSRSQLVTPGERAAVDSYFAQEQLSTDDEYAAGPDFVNLDEKLEGYGAYAYEMDTSQDDEAAVRKLVRGGKGRPSSWLGNMMGWGLFSVDEHDEESEEADEDAMSDGELDEGSVVDVALNKTFKGTTSLPAQRLPPPQTDEGGWQDAAWLLSVASKVAWS